MAEVSCIDEATVSFALISFIQEIRNNIAVLTAVIEYRNRKSPQNTFLQQTEKVFWQQVVMDIQKFFDRANTGKNKPNCTLAKLSELCEKSCQLSVKQRNMITNDINDLQKKYEELFPIDMRNKRTMHHDLYSVFQGNEIEISFSAVELLIEDTTKCVSQICGLLFGRDVILASIEDTVKIVDKSIAELVQGSVL